MSRIYIYKDSHDTIIKVNDDIIPLIKHKNCWYLAIIPGLYFTYESKTNITQHSIPQISEYALYKNELLPINNNLYSKILLISDIDGTLYKENPEALQALDLFNKFWISNFEFNGSKLVYNTGRAINELHQYKNMLLMPDLIITVIGSYAYEINDYWNEKLMLDYDHILNDYIEGDWDSFLLYQLLIEKFSDLRSCFSNILSRRVLLIVPHSFLSQYYNELEEFIINKNKEIRKGKCMMGRLLCSQQWLVGESFLDSIPCYCTKNTGNVYSQRKLGFSNENTLCAGDSMNDIDMFNNGTHGVIVANAEPSLVKWFNQENRPLVYQSAFNYANGIIEALQQFKIA